MSDRIWWIKNYYKQLRDRFTDKNVDRNKDYVKEQYAKTGNRDVDMYFEDVQRKIMLDGKITKGSTKLVRDFYVDQIAEQIRQCGAKRVLEVGAGTALNMFLLSERFPDVHFEGIDLTPERVEVAKQWFQTNKNYSPNIQIGDVTQLDYEDGAFDLIYSVHCFEQLNQYSLAGVKEACRVAKKKVVCVEPDFRHSNATQRLFLKNHDYLVDFSKTIESVAPGKLTQTKLNTYITVQNRSGLFVVDLD